VSLNFKDFILVEKSSLLHENIEDYKIILTGKIEYKFVLNKLEKFEGLIKLKKDPKFEKILPHNIVLNGVTIMHTDWLNSILSFSIVISF
jgi:hypothetical protein